MFCPSNETLLSITEKTKLLAQKCTQQIRAQSGLSPMRREPPTFHLPTPTGPPLPLAAAPGVEDNTSNPKETENGALPKVVSQKAMSENEVDTKEAEVNGGGGLAASLNCFNSRGGMKVQQVTARKKSTGGFSSSANTQKERTTMWYVKVIQMACQWEC